MNLDIFELNDGEDIVLAKSDAARAGNVLSVQEGDLEYAPNFGVDKRYFLESEFQIQNESFKAYLVSRLLHHQINITTVLTTINDLSDTYGFGVGNNQNSTTELIS